MHSQGVLHRDMKSLNILLDNDLTAKISDFGLSKIKTKNQTASSNIYVQNNVFGSLLWKAPESFSIRNPYTDKADIYALGIVFWEIASCQVPYEGFDSDTIKDSVKSGERLEIPSTCPESFKELIELCWAQEPKRRPTASIVFEKISQLMGQIQKYDSENLSFSVPQIYGSNSDPVITFQEVSKMEDPHPIFTGSTQNRYVTDNQSAQINEESEIEKKIRLAKEKQQFLLLEKKKREDEEERFREYEKIKQQEEQKRKQDTIEKENQRIDKERKEEQERIQKEKRLQEELEKKKKEEEERKKIEEEKRKQEEKEIQKKDEKKEDEYERIEKWKSTYRPDFEGNIFEAAAKGNLPSIIYLLEIGENINKKYPIDEKYGGWHMKNSTPLHFSSRYGHLNVVEYLVNQKADINAKNDWVAFFYLMILLFIMLLKKVILVLLNI